MPLNNIWAQLDKLTEQEIKDLNIDYIDEYSILPEDVVTDGNGNFYKIPTSGYTKVDELENDKYFKYRYNWTTNEIEVFLKNGATDDNIQNMELIESVGVSAYDFIDNPEYWYETVAESIEEDTGIDLRDFEVEEAIESINMNDESSEGTNHQIVCEYNIEMKDNNDQTTFEDFNKFIEEYKNYLEHYELNMQLYDATLVVKLQLSEDQEYVIININYPVELSDEELKTIFDDCKTYISGIASDYFYINSVNILNIIK